MGKNILICGENLNDGGVETAIVNDAIVLKKRNNNVYVLAKKGIYTQKIEEYGIENIEFEFEFINGFDLKGAQEIVNIIKEKNIEEVHIHKFINIPACIPACIIAKVPYIVHLHEGLPTSYEWVMNYYDMYKNMLGIYFKNAYKIIAITENVKKFNMQLFHIPEEKYEVIHNSINFELFENNVKSTMPIKNFLLISRLANEKKASIRNGIDLFAEYSQRVDGCRMRIAGSGNIEDELKQYIDKKGYTNIKFIGQTEKIPKEIANADIVLGMGRCIIEAMASKRLCCIAGYESLKPILKPDILESAKFENFSGRGLQDKTAKEIIEEIISLEDAELEQIVENNYNFAKEEFDIEKNIYTIEENSNMDYNVEVQLFEMLHKYQEDMKKEKEKTEEIWKAKVWIEEQYNNATKELGLLKQSDKTNLVNRIINKLKNKIKEGVNDGKQ